MLMRFDPFREFDRLAHMLGQPPEIQRRLSMPMDAYRQGDHLFVHFDLPGVDPNAIELTVEKNGLTVEVERAWEPEEDTEIIVLERPQGVFKRQLYLGDTLDIESVAANYQDGVLTLIIPVAEQAKPRKVEIMSSSQTAELETVG